MAKVKPFRAIRPAKGLEDKIAALPYDVYSSSEAREVVKKEPMSFLRIDRAETQFPEDVDMYSDAVYQKAHDLLWGMIERGEFIREQKACYYIYELVYQERVQDGIAACVAVKDYTDGVIRRHENTRRDKEEDRIRHIDACQAQTGPIFLAYRSQQELQQIVEREKEREPVYDFETEDGVIHRVWIITSEKVIARITELFGQMDHLYIADGHHRAASAVRVGLQKAEAAKNPTGEEEFNYFLAVMFPKEQLRILDYNRVVKDLHGLSVEQFLEKLQEKFTVEARTEAVSPEKKGTFGLYVDGTWYALTYKGDMDALETVDRLDVSILQKEVLDALLGIQDPKTDQRIKFVGGIRGLQELEKNVDQDGWAAAFSMYPTSMDELLDIADAGLLMPPKSTWFEPKLRSGLFIHEI
ncbi:DUF1015 domain-containing protein [Oscillospiraceae bacterium Marseille-Q3528]|nr:DUF1015 domain-containing protein [Oscillospiraceae bacterium Marseille-Q3528]WNV56521.1 DUF1015 family protein [Oscillospiraceae bacterium NTUH-002-81]